jgi:hypothetical protein
VTDARLTDALAARALGWRPAPDRYIKPGRNWIPRSKFRPFPDLKDAFRLLDAATKDYSLISLPEGGFSAEVRLPGRIGRGREPKASTIALAVAKALGIEAEHTASGQHDAAPPSTVRRCSGHLP